MTDENTQGKNNHDDVDEWGEESFPASDPPSNTPRPEEKFDTETGEHDRDNEPDSGTKEE